MKKEEIKKTSGKELLEVYRLLREQKEYLEKELSKMDELKNEERSSRAL